MAFASSLDVKERIRQAVDIVDLIGGYLQLRREGRGYKALCPWHDDTKPSLQINPERQSFKCWVCGDKGGDIFSFVMAIERVEFPEALAMLAERAGVQLDKPARGAGPPPDEKRTLFQAMAWAAGQYHRLLLSGEQATVARRYFAERSITQASIERFQLGYSPVDWDWILQAAKNTSFTPALLEKADVVGRRQSGNGYYDRFRNRVLFPIFDAQGRAIAMGGRVLPGPDADKTAKYLNSRETALFTKSNQLYGLSLARDAIRKTGTVLVMEGYTDVVIAHQCGFENAVAVLGTALGSRQIQLLKRFADRLQIVLVLDGDEAGRKRANEVLELFVAENADVRVLTLPEEFDPAEFLLERGPQALQALVEVAPDALAHAVKHHTTGIDLARDTHRASEALEKLLDMVAKGPRLRDDTTTEGRLREEAILTRLARDFALPEETLRKRLMELRKKSQQRPAKGAVSTASSQAAASPNTTSPNSASPKTGPAEKVSLPEREVLELVLAAPAILDRLANSVKPNQLASNLARQVYVRALELHAAGVLVDFHRLLLEIDDPQVKNLLVELDEQARLKPNLEFEPRLQDVLASFQRRTNAEEVRAQTTRLNDEQLPEEEALALLLKIQQQVKSRQGISAPMDG